MEVTEQKDKEPRKVFRVLTNDAYTKDQLEMSEEEYDAFADKISDFLDELYRRYCPAFDAFQVIFDGRRRGRICQSVLAHINDHPEQGWALRIARAPYHRWKGSGRIHGQMVANRTLPNAILIIRDNRFERSEVEQFVNFAAVHKVQHSDTCFQVRILLPQFQSKLVSV